MESYTLEEKVLRKVMRNIPMGLIVSKEGFRRKIYYVNDTACEIMAVSYTHLDVYKRQVVNISDSTIRTTENNSGGIQTTGGGTMNAANLDVETQENSAAAIRSDRGGGTVNVDCLLYTSRCV